MRECVEVEESFGRRCGAARGSVMKVIRQRRVEEPELAWADVCVKAWRHYPRMYAEERAALEAGKECPHDWTGWLVTIAVNHTIDLHRRKHGRQRVRGEGKDEGTARRREERLVVLPLHEGVVAAPAESDPQVMVVLEETWRGMNETLAALEREERLALSVLVMDDVEDEGVAVKLGTSARTVRRRRRRAISRVREAMRERGWGEARHFRVAA